MSSSDIDHQLKVGAQRVVAAKVALQNNMPTGYVLDPAVLILFNLFVFHCDGVTPSIRSVLEALPAVSVSVSTRWIKAIEIEGLIALIVNDLDSGEPSVSLTERGQALVRRTILAVGEAERAVRQSDHEGTKASYFASKRA